MAKSYERRGGRILYNTLIIIGAGALATFCIMKPIGERDTANAFNEQYRDCLSGSAYDNGKTDVSGVVWFGDTKVTVQPAETLIPGGPTQELVFTLGSDDKFRAADLATRDLVDQYCTM